MNKSYRMYEIYYDVRHVYKAFVKAYFRMGGSTTNTTHSYKHKECFFFKYYSVYLRLPPPPFFDITITIITNNIKHDILDRIPPPPPPIKSFLFVFLASSSSSSFCFFISATVFSKSDVCVVDNGTLPEPPEPSDPPVSPSVIPLVESILHAALTSAFDSPISIDIIHAL